MTEHPCDDRTNMLLFPVGTPLFSLLFTTNMMLYPATPVSAQSVLEEIIVTAQKREQNLQDVSLSVTALSGETMRELGFQSATDIVAQAPNVLFRTTGPLPTFTIRGVTLIDVGDGNEPPVGFYIDEVYRGTAAGQSNQLFDIDRVEILRGPQGTLFGRNTTGGLVHFVTRKPTDTFGGYAEFQYGSNDQRIVEAALGGPLSDRLKGRIAIKYNEDDGWQDNQTTGTDFAVTDTLAGRAQLEIDLTDDATVLFSVSGSKQDNKHAGYGFAGTFDPATFATCSVNDVNNGRCINFAGFNVPAPDPEKVFSEEDELQDEVDIFNASARLDWNFGGMSLTSITAFESVEKMLEEDTDASPVIPVTFVYRVDAEQFSQELRLTGERDRLRWLVGGFYYNDDKDDMFVSAPFFVSLFGTVGNQNESELETESWAIFGKVDFDLSEQLTVSAALRYTDENKDLFITDSKAAPNFMDRETIDADKLTGRFALEWRPSNDLMAFVSVSTGFKSGSFNTTQVGPGGAAPVGEEEITAVEAGIKSAFWEDRLRVNVTGFYYDYTDIQSVAVVSSAAAPVPTALFLNAGDADVYGLEAELVAAPVENLEFTFALGLTDSELDGEPGVTVDGFSLDGNELTHTPAASINGIVRYHIPTSNIGRFTLQTDFRWQDDILLSIDNDPFDAQDSYGVLNLRARWRSPGEHYYAEAFVENVLDEDYFEGSFTVRAFGFRAAIWGKPQWCGLRVGARF